MTKDWDAASVGFRSGDDFSEYLKNHSEPARTQPAQEAPVLSADDWMAIAEKAGHVIWPHVREAVNAALLAKMQGSKGARHEHQRNLGLHLWQQVAHEPRWQVDPGRSAVPTGCLDGAAL